MTIHVGQELAPLLAYAEFLFKKEEKEIPSLSFSHKKIIHILDLMAYLLDLGE